MTIILIELYAMALCKPKRNVLKDFSDKERKISPVLKNISLSLTFLSNFILKLFAVHSRAVLNYFLASNTLSGRYRVT